MGATTAAANTRPAAARSGTVSISGTQTIRSSMIRSSSSTGRSGPENAKQSSVSCAIANSFRYVVSAARELPAWRGVEECR